MTSSSSINPTERARSKEIINTNLTEAYKLSIQNKNIENCFKELENVNIDYIPYAVISLFVYSHKEDFDGFLVFFEQAIYNLPEDNLKDYKVSRKILEHMELANQQKESLFLGHEKELASIKYKYDDLLVKYKDFKEKNEKNSREAEALKNSLNKIRDEMTKNAMNQISVLGVFAAILMGAFGSIQAFTNIFDNAKDLDLGLILILSAVGGASVITILHLLLHSIAKLTKQSIRSVEKEDATPFEKYPFFFLAMAGMVLIALIGVATKLSNIQLTFAWHGAWWLLPLIWSFLMGYLYQKK